MIELTRLDPQGFPARRKAALDYLLPGQRAEMDGLAPILEKSGALPGKVPDVPTVVLTSLVGTQSLGPGAVKLWRDLHEELFHSTTNGMHIVTSKSGHTIQNDEPQLVVDAIRWVIERSRTPK